MNFQGLWSMKMSRNMPQNLLFCRNKKIQLYSFKKIRDKTAHELLLLFNLKQYMYVLLKSIFISLSKKIKMSAGQFTEKFNLARNKLCNLFFCTYL